MAAGHEQNIRNLQTLNARAAKASELIADLRQQLAESHKREQILHSELAETRRQLQKAQTDISYLRVSHRLAASPDSIIEARRMISNFIRSIDKVIADLKE